MASSKELVGASTGLLVLGVLARGASYGYEIVRKVNEAAEGMFVWQEGTLYPVLHRLEKEGLVIAKWQQAETGRERKYYHITAKGRAAMKSDVKQWAAFHELVVRVAMGGGHA